VGEFDDFRGEVSVLRRWKAIGGAAVALAAVGGGAAFAATQLDTPSARSQAIINDAAGQLGVPPDKLSSALEKALEDQLQADVTAGRLTQAQADAQKQRIESGNYPLLGTGGGFGRGGGRGGFGHGGFGHSGFGFGAGFLADYTTAATYLKLTPAQLRTDLMSGKTLAEIATAQGETADDLVSTLVSAVEKQLDAAVTAGKLTSAQEQAVEKNLQQQITDLVNGKRPTAAPGMFGGPNFRAGHSSSENGGFGTHGFRRPAQAPSKPQNPA
jgi:hypothetical protein